MDSFGVARKRIRQDATLNGSAIVVGSKRFKQGSGVAEMESFPTSLGSKSKPCTEFFSMVGCPFGESCHFLYYVPGGINAMAQMANMTNPALPVPVRPAALACAPLDGQSAPLVKTRMCNKYSSAESCKFGDKCHFAHSERKLGKTIPPAHDDCSIGPMTGRLAGRLEPPPPGLAAAASFGASAIAKISVDASLAGGIIGKGGVNSKPIFHVIGAKLSIREHEMEANLGNIE